MLIQKGFKYRLYPTKEQEKLLLQHGGNTRFVWNLFLQQNIEKYEKEKKFIFFHDLANSLPKLKQQHEFLKYSYSQSLQQVAKHLDRALKDSYKTNKGFPKFKKKMLLTDSFAIPQNYKLKQGYVVIPKIGKVRWVKHRSLQGKPKKITISQEGNRWYCSVLCEYEKKEQPKKTDNLIGIDVGLKHFATLSNGETIKNIRTLKKHEKKLKREQRRLSRKEKGSNNRHKQRLAVHSIHTKIKNIRKDFLYKTTYSIAKNYDGVVLENLNVKGMMKNHNLSKAISDVSWSEFKRQLEYKCKWRNKYFVVIDRFKPTTKACSDCGCIQEMKLSDRIFECKDCGLILDRDYNAAINILKLGCIELNVDFKDFKDLNRLGHSRIYACGEEGSGLNKTSFKRNYASMKQEKEDCVLLYQRYNRT
jgi:putative transposase